METRIVVAAVILGILGIWSHRYRRQRPDPPTQPRAHVPALLDRNDFPSSGLDWLVVLFSSSDCERCADIAPKVSALESEQVAIAEVEYHAERSLHERYGIDAVPLVLIADRSGTVREHFAGAMTATDLWATLARLRDPDRVPPGCGEHGTA